MATIRLSLFTVVALYLLIFIKPRLSINPSTASTPVPGVAASSDEDDPSDWNGTDDDWDPDTALMSLNSYQNSSLAGACFDTVSQAGGIEKCVKEAEAKHHTNLSAIDWKLTMQMGYVPLNNSQPDKELCAAIYDTVRCSNKEACGSCSEDKSQALEWFSKQALTNLTNGKCSSSTFEDLDKTWCKKGSSTFVIVLIIILVGLPLIASGVAICMLSGDQDSDKDKKAPAAPEGRTAKKPDNSAKEKPGKSTKSSAAKGKSTVNSSSNKVKSQVNSSTSKAGAGGKSVGKSTVDSSKAKSQLKSSNSKRGADDKSLSNKSRVKSTASSSNSKA